MDEDIIKDFKQFIAVTVHQEVSTVREDISDLKQDVSVLKQDVSVLKQNVKVIDHKIDNLSKSVAEALDEGNDVVDAQLKDHGKRIARLERRVA